MTFMFAFSLFAAAKEAKSIPSPSNHHFAELVSDIILAITAIFIAYQGWETKRAAQATRDSVDAIREQAKILERQTVAAEQAAQTAKDSTTALANIERAWVDMRLIRETEGLYTLELTNCGRTVAHIKQLVLRCTITPAGRDVVFEPSTDRTLAQNKLLIPTVPWPALALDLRQALGTDTYHQVRAGTLRLHYRIIVRYASISPNCETEQLYYFNSALDYQCLVPIEASEYYRYT